jgi:hypothetical protein
VLVLLKAHWPALAGPALYGLFAATCIFVLHWAGTGKPLFSRQQPQTTLENIEANIRVWLDNFRLAAKKENHESTHFSIIVTLNNGNPVQVSRYKVTERYLTFQTRLAVSAEHQVPVDAMISTQRDRMMREITLELGRAKIGFTFEGPPFRSIVISKLSIISSKLTEDAFVAILDEMDSAVTLARASTVMAIERNSSQPTTRSASARPELTSIPSGEPVPQLTMLDTPRQLPSQE